MSNLLPEGFGELECFVDEWVLPDSSARAAKRQASTYREIKAFYDSMVPHAERALEFLDGFRLGELDEPAERLLKLTLSLAEIGPAVEWYEDPRVADGYPAERFPLTELIPDTSLQR